MADAQSPLSDCQHIQNKMKKVPHNLYDEVWHQIISFQPKLPIQIIHITLLRPEAFLQGSGPRASHGLINIHFPDCGNDHTAFATVYRQGLANVLLLKAGLTARGKWHFFLAQ